MTANDFVARFPEWIEVNDESPETIEKAIADAAMFVDATIWGDRYEAGLAYKAADLLSTTPLGEHARLRKDSIETTYGERFREMRLALPIRMMIL